MSPTSSMYPACIQHPPQWPSNTHSNHPPTSTTIIRIHIEGMQLASNWNPITCCWMVLESDCSGAGARVRFLPVLRGAGPIFFFWEVGGRGGQSPRKKVWPLTFDPYRSKKPSPECQFENDKFKLRSLTGKSHSPLEPTLAGVLLKVR